jgi:F0F1-type ATP synthase assembly protein I
MSLILPDPRKPEKRNLAGPIARAGSIGLHLASGMLVGGFIGHFLDKWRGTGYWLPVFFALGFAAGVMNTVRDIRKLLREQENDAHPTRRHTPEDGDPPVS